jgi:cysteine synthase
MQSSVGLGNFVPGPTYEEMLNPRSPLSDLPDELAPANLFRITWRKPGGGVRCVALPKAMTGVKANILVMVGCYFPSGSHKVGPAYATLMEGELAGEIQPGVHTLVGPSTGNFGIGVAYIARLKGYPAVVIMPDGMSAERYERIRCYGGRLELTPGSESDVMLVLKRAEEYRNNCNNKVLAQFELLPNYRFHRYVTGRSALEAARHHGDRGIAAFVAAPGSAGTLAAGDEIKACLPDCVVCALEPRECPTLFSNGAGTHRIEGIGDKMVTLIHNVRTTDYVALIHDGHCLTGLYLLERRQAALERMLSLAEGSLRYLRGLFGISGMCNIIGSIRMARFLELGPRDNVVTVATDGFDRYPSVISGFELADAELGDHFEEVFRSASSLDILDVRSQAQKHRLFDYKEQVWSGLNYSHSYLERMKSQSFWDEEYGKIREIDAALQWAREQTGQ